jgi:hypothetical protein
MNVATMKRKRERPTISCGQAARLLGDVLPPTVRKWCRNGLVGSQDDRTGWYFLTPSEIEWLRDPDNRPKPGHPASDS